VAERGTSSEAILVIGYGNELRGDDGLGPRVAESLVAANYPDVRVRTVCQLVPELSAELAEARMVIFVDALADPSRSAVELTPVGAEEIADWSTHTADPRTLLALTRAVFGRTLEAWWLKVPGRHFDFSMELSSAAQQNARQAIARLEMLIQEVTRSCPHGIDLFRIHAEPVDGRLDNTGVEQSMASKLR
jgi:hydrogenase maturation protease